jgi:hypothetical protein
VSRWGLVKGDAGALDGYKEDARWNAGTSSGAWEILTVVPDSSSGGNLIPCNAGRIVTSSSVTDLEENSPPHARVAGSRPGVPGRNYAAAPSSSLMP